MPVSSPIIYVLAGVNGSGKSSVGGAVIRKNSADYFNPDEAAKKIQKANPGLSLSEANGIAWEEGKRLLERAIAERLDYAFETTLGGQTMTELLEKAIAAGLSVWVWYVGLDSPERCIDRVKARVAAGGHDIPEDKIRARYVQSPLNLIRLLPKLSRLLVYDNSAEGNPRQGKHPRLKLILDLKACRLRKTCDLSTAPQWAKPILLAALKCSRPIQKA